MPTRPGSGARTPEALADAACAAAAMLADRHRSAVLPRDALVIAAARRSGGAADVGEAAVQHAVVDQRLTQVTGPGGTAWIGPCDVLDAERGIATWLAEHPPVTVERHVGVPPVSEQGVVTDLERLDAAGLRRELREESHGPIHALRGAGGVLGNGRVDLLAALVEAGVPDRAVLPDAGTLVASRRAELALEVDAGDVRALPPVDRDVFVGAESDRSRLLERVVRAVTAGVPARLGVGPADCEVSSVTAHGPLGVDALRTAIGPDGDVRVANIHDEPADRRAVVVLVVDRSHEALLDRTVLATAIGRPEEHLIVLGDPDALRRAARRPAPRRWSTIAAQLAAVR